MPATIFRAAQARLLDIWDYTERTWSEARADSYVRELVAAAHQASDEKPGGVR
jgi:plasmid stabilization system protein ParE